jgi:hypothetical protein
MAIIIIDIDKENRLNQLRKKVLQIKEYFAEISMLDEEILSQIVPELNTLEMRAVNLTTNHSKFDGIMRDVELQAAKLRRLIKEIYKSEMSDDTYDSKELEECKSKLQSHNFDRHGEGPKIPMQNISDDKVVVYQTRTKDRVVIPDRFDVMFERIVKKEKFSPEAFQDVCEYNISANFHEGQKLLMYQGDFLNMDRSSIARLAMQQNCIPSQIELEHQKDKARIYKDSNGNDIYIRQIGYRRLAMKALNIYLYVNQMNPEDPHIVYGQIALDNMDESYEQSVSDKLLNYERIKTMVKQRQGYIGHISRRTGEPAADIELLMCFDFEKECARPELKRTKEGYER